MEDFAGDGALEAAEDVFLRLAFGAAAGRVGAGFGVCGQAHDRDLVERGVRGPVAAAVESVTCRFPRGGGQGRGTAEHRESCLGAEPVGVVACGDQQLRGGHSRDTSGLHESRVHCVDELCEVGVVTGDLLIELLIAGGEALECRAGPGRDLVVTDTCTGACQACDQAGRGQVTELGSDALRSSHDQRLELHDHLGSCFHRAAPGRVGDPDRFHDAGAGLRGHGVVVRQRDVRGGVGIDLVGLAAHPPCLPCRADHLDDLDARLMQMPGQARPVRVRALHTGAQQSAVAGDEALKRAVAGVGGGELGGAEGVPR